MTVLDLEDVERYSDSGKTKELAQGRSAIRFDLNVVKLPGFRSVGDQLEVCVGKWRRFDGAGENFKRLVESGLVSLRPSTSSS